MARILEMLLQGPCGIDRRLAHALLLVESAAVPDQATEATCAPSAELLDGQLPGAGPVLEAIQQYSVRDEASLKRGQDATQALLSRNQNSFPLWAAYARLLEDSGQLKARVLSQFLPP